MMDIGPVVMRVLAFLVAMSVAVLAEGARIVRVIMVPVIVAMSVLVLHRSVAMKVTVPLGDVQIDARGEEQPGDEGRRAHRVITDRPGDHDADEGAEREEGSRPAGAEAALGQEVKTEAQPVADAAAREQRQGVRGGGPRLSEEPRGQEGEQRADSRFGQDDPARIQIGEGARERVVERPAQRGRRDSQRREPGGSAR